MGGSVLSQSLKVVNTEDETKVNQVFAAILDAAIETPHGSGAIPEPNEQDYRVAC